MLIQEKCCFIMDLLLCNLGFYDGQKVMTIWTYVIRVSICMSMAKKRCIMLLKYCCWGKGVNIIPNEVMHVQERYPLVRSPPSLQHQYGCLMSVSFSTKGQCSAGL